MMTAELDRLDVVYKKKLVPEVRILTVKRELVRIDGERQVLIAKHAKSQGTMAKSRPRSKASTGLQQQRRAATP